MNVEIKFLGELFYKIEVALFKKNKWYFLFATIIMIVSGFFLYNEKPIYLTLLVSYPIVYLLFLVVYNYTHIVIVSALGLRNGETPKITKPDFVFTDSVGAKRISIEYDSSLELDENISRIDNIIDDISKCLDIIYYGMISVPVNAYIGYKIGQKRNVKIYNYNRTCNKWVMIDEFENSGKSNAFFKKGLNSSILNVLLPLSYTIDYELVVDKDCDMLEIKIENLDIDHDIPYQEIVKLITDKSLKYNKINFYVAANNGFVFYLGSRLRDSNIPMSYFYEYGGRDQKKYVFRLNINRGDWELL